VRFDFNPRLIRLYICSLAVTITGCMDTSPLVLKSTYESLPARPNIDQARDKSAMACTINLDKLIDKRADPLTLGTLAGRPVRTPPNRERWLHQVFQRLDDYGVIMVGNESTAKVQIEIELLTAWVSGMYETKTANIVIRVTYLHRNDGENPDPKLYRGAVSSVNWANEDDEIQEMVDGAFAKIMQNLGADLRSLCST